MIKECSHHCSALTLPTALHRVAFLRGKKELGQKSAKNEQKIPIR